MKQYKLKDSICNRGALFYRTTSIFMVSFPCSETCESVFQTYTAIITEDDLNMNTLVKILEEKKTNEYSFFAENLMSLFIINDIILSVSILCQYQSRCKTWNESTEIKANVNIRK